MENKNSGQSLIELLVAMGIFVISLAASFQLFFGGQSLSVDSINERLATDYGEEAVSALHSIRNRNFSELTNGSHGLVFQNNEWMFGSSSTSDVQGGFTRTISVADGDNDNIKIATTTIAWNTDPLRNQKVEIVEKLVNWEQPSESSCKTDPVSGDWTNPKEVGSADLGPGNQGTDVVIHWPYAYVSGVASSAAKPDIFIYDISNPAVPSLVSSKDFGSGGINSIYLKGNYLFAASPNNSMELMIIDVSNPAAMSLVGSYNLAGSDDGLTVIAFGNTVAVGREATASGRQLAFLDVSNVANPSVISEVDIGEAVYDFAATSNDLFVATTNASKESWVYNITNPAVPVLKNTYDFPASSGSYSTYLYFRGSGTNLLSGTSANEVAVIGATTTSKMYVRSRLDVGGQVNDIVCTTGNLAFLSTNNGGAEFTVVNATDPDHITSYATLNFPQIATGIDFANNYVFMAVRSNDALRIITSQ